MVAPVQGIHPDHMISKVVVWCCPTIGQHQRRFPGAGGADFREIEDTLVFSRWRAVYKSKARTYFGPVAGANFSQGSGQVPGGFKNEGTPAFEITGPAAGGGSLRKCPLWHFLKLSPGGDGDPDRRGAGC